MDSRLRKAKDAVRGATTVRRSSDRILSPYIVWLVILIELSMVIPGLVLFYAALFESMDEPSYVFDDIGGSALIGIVLAVIGATVSTFILAVVSYMLVRRMNDHFTREGRLKSAILMLLRDAATVKSEDSSLYYQAQVASALQPGSEPRRSPWLYLFIMLMTPLTSSVVVFGMLLTPDIWILIAILMPFDLVAVVFMFYMFYFLHKEFYAHDQRWIYFSGSVRSALSRLGFPSGRPFSIKPMEERSFVLYFVLTLFLGVFIYYWWYTLLKDPNEHFRSQWEFEDHLLGVLGEAPV